MPLLVLKCALWCALMAITVCACMLKNHTIWIERQNCTQCVAINTTICSGYCYTRGRFGRSFLIQRSCVPLSLVYQAVFLPGCPQDVDPHLHYPVARRCSCRSCDTRTHHCISENYFGCLFSI
uniref:Gonadotropin subunit beta-2 n=1 Tax=Kryptolebias marmoratus TaxID=37003 RepID=A0A3Q3BCV4_KRYMA